MLYDPPFKNPKDVPDLLGKIRSYAQKAGPIRLMEVCQKWHQKSPSGGPTAFIRPRMPRMCHTGKLYGYDP